MKPPAWHRMSAVAVLTLLVAVAHGQPAPAGSAAASAPPVKIGNYLVDEPYGIAIIVEDETAFVFAPRYDGPSRNSRYASPDAALFPPGMTAPDFSFSEVTFPNRDAQVRLTWGRAGASGVVGELSTDRPTSVTLHFPARTWPQFHAIYTAAGDGVTGQGIEPRGRFVGFRFRAEPAPVLVRANITAEADVVLALDPRRPARFVAGIGDLPELSTVEATLRRAGQRYGAQRIAAEGDWGDFLGAIADNVNNSRFYGSDNHRIAIGDGRGWWLQHLKDVAGDADLFPYFGWDFFFNAMLGSLEDAASARDTVRAALSFQLPDGRLPSFSHWGNENHTYVTLHRTMPPVAAMAVWKLHERRPDRGFLAEVYPRLSRFHGWWMTARDSNRNGLLEWGSEQRWWQGAQYETGWDDNVEFIGAHMAGTTMNADAVDLNSLWSMDAEYLEKIATALGKTADAARFRSEREQMNQRINARLWNEQLGIYCSRLWQVPAVAGPALAARQVFPQGFEAEFYRDLGLVSPAARRHEADLNFSWADALPAEGLQSGRWSARFSGSISVPQSGRYRFLAAAGDDFRLTFDGKPVGNWEQDSEDRRLADFDLQAGKSYPVVLEFFATGAKPQLKFSVQRLEPGSGGSDWLTRLTPMNFYPLIAGAADKTRAEKTLAWMYRPDKFWLPALLPTVAQDDPVWHEQGYWHGHVWAPANYLVWLGVVRYADGAHQAEYARRSVELFMRNWRDKRVNCENYKSTDGSCGDDPHYVWGALLNWIGLEAVAGVGADLRPVPRDNSALREHLVLRRVPFGGRLYRIEAQDGRVRATPE